MGIAQDKGITELRARLAALDAQITHLREVHQRQGDRLAGRLMASAEEEHEKVLSKPGGEP